MQAMISAVRNFCEWAALQGGDTRSEFEFALSVVEWDREITLPEPTNPPWWIGIWRPPVGFPAKPAPRGAVTLIGFRVE